MMKTKKNPYDVVYLPDPVLREEAKAVENITDELRDQIDRMFVTMRDYNGIGLAANQVGKLNRVFVMDVDPDCWAYETVKPGLFQIVSSHRNEEEAEEAAAQKNNQICMINPEIIYQSEERSLFEEGCLSIPAQHAQVERPAKIIVSYLNYEGQKQEMTAEGLVATCIQHELDHLNGVLFIDYLSRLKRGTLIRKLEKYKKENDLI